MWIKNTEGKPDAMLTFAVVAFAVVMLNVFLATFGTVTIAGATITFTALSAGTITALLGPTLTAYVGRRFTGAAYPGFKLGLDQGGHTPGPADPQPEEPPAASAEPLDEFIPSGDR